MLLKGAGTIISSPPGRPLRVCPYGNPAMSTAGMGDLLGGIIGGLIAQGMDLQTATELGCCMHSFAADKATEELGPRGLVATDILAYLGDISNQRNFDEL